MQIIISDDAIYNLQDSPYIGRYVPELSDKHFRELICEKYRINFYTLHILRKAKF